eukprot:snap_masked-scaffold_45-processed-gene-1.78-mRNA-1 protein AED:1.00 eAED:1.00 QI:0/0/0/0/1/1/2/0/293
MSTFDTCKDSNLVTPDVSDPNTCCRTCCELTFSGDQLDRCIAGCDGVCANTGNQVNECLNIGISFFNGTAVDIDGEQLCCVFEPGFDGEFQLVPIDTSDTCTDIPLERTPTTSATDFPTTSPSSFPTQFPSETPTFPPSDQPTSVPSITPTISSQASPNPEDNYLNKRQRKASSEILEATSADVMNKNSLSASFTPVFVDEETVSSSMAFSRNKQKGYRNSQLNRDIKQGITYKKEEEVPEFLKIFQHKKVPEKGGYVDPNIFKSGNNEPKQRKIKKKEIDDSDVESIGFSVI